MVVMMNNDPNYPGWNQPGDTQWSGQANSWGQPAGPKQPPAGAPAKSSGPLWALGGAAVMLLLVLAGGIGYYVASRGSGEPPASVTAGDWSTPTAAAHDTEGDTLQVTDQPSDMVTVTVTTTPGIPPGETGPGHNAGGGDLGLSVPLARPSCDGQGIVVLYSAVTPGAYAQEIESALAQYPGASYLRTDMACPSLRQRDENGNAIYAVFYSSGYSKQELCADVRSAGPPAYGRWLDMTSDPTALVTC